MYKNKKTESLPNLRWSFTSLPHYLLRITLDLSEKVHYNAVCLTF